MLGVLGEQHGEWEMLQGNVGPSWQWGEMLLLMLHIRDSWNHVLCVLPLVPDIPALAGIHFCAQ